MKSLTKNEKGFTLIEVLVALAILATVGTGFLMALTIASKAIIIADERTTAESLARSQMEYVKNLDYIDYSDPDRGEPYYYDEITPSDSNYSIDFTVVPFNPATDPYTWYIPDGNGVSDQDLGIQKITVTVSYLGDPVLTLEDYKVER